MDQYRTFAFGELSYVEEGDYYTAVSAVAPISIDNIIRDTWKNAGHRGKVRCQNVGAINDPVGTWVALELI